MPSAPLALLSIAAERLVEVSRVQAEALGAIIDPREQVVDDTLCANDEDVGDANDDDGDAVAETTADVSADDATDDVSLSATALACDLRDERAVRRALALGADNRAASTTDADELHNGESFQF